MKRLITLCLILALTACAQAPSQRTETVDDRPRVAFELPAGASAGGYRVAIDDIDYGAMSQYLAGTRSASAVRVLTGRHVIEVWRGEERVIRQEVFLSEGDTRVIPVSAP